MGLAASQARLLTLTARQHTVEQRAQFLQAQKLRLANDSDRVYEKYVNALDSTTLQTRTYDGNGKVHWIDGSYNNLMRYDASNKSIGKVYYVQDINDGKLYVPNKVSQAYTDAGGDYFKFLDGIGIRYRRDVYSDEYYEAKAAVDSDIKNGWNVAPYTPEFLQQYNSLKAKIDYPEQSELYKAADGIFTASNYSLNSNGDNTYVTTSPNALSTLKNDINKLKGSEYYKDDVKTILDFCTSFTILNDTTGINTLSAMTTPDKTLYIYYDKALQEKSDNPVEIDDAYRFMLLLNGGTYKINDGAQTEIYNTNVTNAINNYSTSGNPNIGDVLQQLGREIKNAEENKAIEAAKTALNNFLTNSGKVQSEVETKISNYQKYNRDLVVFNSQSTETHTEYVDEDLGTYYENMYNAIVAAGGCKEISDQNAKSSSWVNSMIKNGQVVLGTFNSTTKELDNISASSNPGLREISNDREITKADLEYETELEAINSKDTKYSTKLNQLESERSAIQTEIESLKKIAKDNIDNTFKLFT